MRVNELAGNEVLARGAAEVGRVTIAKNRERLVVLAKNLNRARKIGHQQRVAAGLEVARLAHRVLDERHMLPRLTRGGLGEILNSVVAAIGDRKRANAIVPPQAVRTRNLSSLAARAANGLLVRAILRVDVHETLAVTVTDKDVAVGRERNIGRVPIALVGVALGAVELGLDRRAVFPHNGSVKLGLDQATVIHIAVIEVLSSILSAGVQTVAAALHLRHHRADELAVLGEDIDRIVLLRLAADGVRNVDVAGLVLRNAMGVAPRESLGRSQPVMLHAILKIALAGRHISSKQRRSECIGKRGNCGDSCCGADEGATSVVREHPLSVPHLQLPRTAHFSNSVFKQRFQTPPSNPQLKAWASDPQASVSRSWARQSWARQASRPQASAGLWAEPTGDPRR